MKEHSNPTQIVLTDLNYYMIDGLMVKFTLHNSMILLGIGRLLKQIVRKSSNGRN